MPGGDRTGPFGAGPRTGRGMGFCAGYNVPGYMNPGFGYGFGRGWGMGRGRGRGNRWGYFFGAPGWSMGYSWPYPTAPVAPDYPAPVFANERDELKFLKEQTKYLTQTLEELNSRIKELTKTKENKEA